MLAPGDRVDVELIGNSEGFSIETAPYTASGGAAYGDNWPLLEVDVPEPDLSAEGVDWSFSGGTPATDPTWTDIVYVLQGGGDPDGWMINGESYPDVTVEQAALGADSIIEVRNLSSTEHPFHLHGMFFQPLGTDGRPDTSQGWKDTINVKRGSTLRFAVRYEPLGMWMFHCHILEHAERGMMGELMVMP